MGSFGRIKSTLVIAGLAASLEVPFVIGLCPTPSFAMPVDSLVITGAFQRNLQALPYRPFSLHDFESRLGRRVPADSLVRVGDSLMVPVSTVLQALNQTERSLAARGQTLRSGNTLRPQYKAVLTQAILDDQAARVLSKLGHPLTAATFVRRRSAVGIRLTSLSTSASQLSNRTNDVNVLDLNLIEATKATMDRLSAAAPVSKSVSWSSDVLGDKSLVALQANASASVSADNNGPSVGISAGLTGWLMGRSKTLLDVSTEMTERSITASASSMGYQLGKKSISTAATSSKLKAADHALDKAIHERFFEISESLGPFDLALEMGMEGSASVSWAIDAKPESLRVEAGVDVADSLGMYIDGSISLDAYIMALEVHGVAKLTIVNLQWPVVASVYLRPAPLPGMTATWCYSVDAPLDVRYLNGSFTIVGRLDFCDLINTIVDDVDIPVYSVTWKGADIPFDDFSFASCP